MSLVFRKFVIKGKSFPLCVFMAKRRNLLFNGNDIISILNSNQDKKLSLKQVSAENRVSWVELKKLLEAENKPEDSLGFLEVGDIDDSEYDEYEKENEEDDQGFKESISFDTLSTLRQIESYFITRNGLLELLRLFKHRTPCSHSDDMITDILFLQRKEILENKASWIKVNLSCLIDQTGYIYIATSNRYANANTYKIGYAKNLSKRLTSLNFNYIHDDLLYFKQVFYCGSNCITMKKQIWAELAQYREEQSTFFKVPNLDIAINVIKKLTT
ncbi:putative BRO-like protein 1 [Diachasmimorpha longicaudata entomopoxvirus]|uniref:Putative BRO-like protein 1 n=1 Tax=Diachasmimorpha longicaudata entomopoxvirus TaxID=109981 RepID=A0A7R5WMH2_9POXV|nr:putative BRO-like protein 1 [Diachasmimorpha longicaudata entomopoxvirus]AKS26374.1 putative BRO-like protein 1 [Diachasmimorpha longicaudata entomopoxvirus]